MAAELLIGGSTMMSCSHSVFGEIEDGDLSKIAELHRDEPVKSVCLNSPGGSWSEGIELAKFFYESGISTAVGPSHQCLSACAIAFLGGSYQGYDLETYPSRYLHRYGKIGFHAPFLEGIQGGSYPARLVELAYKEAMHSVSGLVKLSSELRLPDDFLVRVFSTPRDEMFFVTKFRDVVDLSISLVGYKMPQSLTDSMIRRACAARSDIFAGGRLEIEASSVVDHVFSIPQDVDGGWIFGGAIATVYAESTVSWTECVVRYSPRPIKLVDNSSLYRFLGGDGHIHVRIGEGPFKEFLDGAFESPPPLTPDEVRSAVFPLGIFFDNWSIRTEKVFDPERNIEAERVVFDANYDPRPSYRNLSDFNGTPTQDRCFVIVASRERVDDVFEFIDTMSYKPNDTSVLVASNGWYAASIGLLEVASAKSEISKLVAQDKAPSDAYCAPATRFIDIYKFVTLR